MYEISKRFAFSASHVLDHLPEGHPCARLHGHNYEVELVLAARLLDERGFVFDYNDTAPFKRYLDETCDHQHLNDVYPLAKPTAEKLAQIWFDVAIRLGMPVSAVRVSETPKTWAEFRP